MHELAMEFLFRAAVLMAVMIVFAFALWMLMKILGRMRLDQPFSAADTRTWPLSFVILNAAIYGLVFAAILIAFGNGLISTVVAAAVATLIALRVVPMLASRRLK